MAVVALMKAAWQRRFAAAESSGMALALASAAGLAERSGPATGEVGLPQDTKGWRWATLAERSSSFSFWNAQLAELGNLRKWQAAQQLLARLRLQRLEANGITYISAMAACRNAWVQALLCLEERLLDRRPVQEEAELGSSAGRLLGPSAMRRPRLAPGPSSGLLHCSCCAWFRRRLLTEKTPTSSPLVWPWTPVPEATTGVSRCASGAPCASGAWS
ncbi:unnamed protein product [Polarella glacialis]|uniref:Uncharacterized protein n=1 Tax=Polarella glacialis TaxID=89957 RepID=A0A813H9D9_POLGL|nr:unnamed protein product [Polarella glacialis]